MAEISHVSPLAPKGGFPDLPVIDGVRFAAIAAGVKYQGRKDVMLAEIAPGSAVAGVFTRSATRSAPVLDCQSKLAKGVDGKKPIALLVNSGNANAFTGKRGDASVAAISSAVASAVGSVSGNIFTASTGVIGEPLPHDVIVNNIIRLQGELHSDYIEDAAKAIMTTDTFAKGASDTVSLSTGTAKIAGFAKGSGMIAPDMATMLVYIFTDAGISQDTLQAIVSSENETSFNAITVDSDTSTSDSLMVFATGKGPAVADDTDLALFRTALSSVMRDLAHQVVRDGEGASKFVAVNVSGAQDDASAKKIAKAIADSPLVKTAIAGEDPNWGRVVMALGKCGEPADRDKLSISFGDILVASEGWVSPEYEEAKGAAYMKNESLEINVDIGLGKGSFTVWTCDLTHQYITINADYRS